MQKVAVKSLKKKCRGWNIKENAFKTPPKEWIEHKLDNLHETISMNTQASALALKDLFGTIEMEPVPGECVVENGRLIQAQAYYTAHTKIDTLDLIDETKGSNLFQRRKRRDSNPRSVARLLFSRQSR